MDLELGIGAAAHLSKLSILDGPPLLRHTLATLAYRGEPIANTPDGFAAFRTHETLRTPGEILAQIGDLQGWALETPQGKYVCKRSDPLPWEEESARLFTA